MELVKNINDVIENAKMADELLKNGAMEDKEFMLEKISRGMCFVVLKEGEDYKFYPSKYIGYKNNNPANYQNALYYASALPGETERNGDAGMFDFDGRMSNKVINTILKCKCEKDYYMSEKFNAYCKKIGINGSDNKKFWKNIIEI